MRQSDIVQYTGMARQQTDFRNNTGEEPYWTDSAFGGMPTYQLGAQYPHSYLKKIDRLIRFLPRPADYLFLYFIGFYILLLVLKVDYKLAFLGSLAFGFSTYFIIIIGVGHNAKAHAIGYMPLVLSGILLIFKKKRILGFGVLALSMGLEIAANHFQMTYYLFLAVLIMGICYLVDAFKKKTLPAFFQSVGIMVVAVLFSVLMNATSLLATKEYTKYSTRGSSDITITADGSQKTSSGLDYEYITTYSYGILESFNLFIPRFMGGSSSENIGKDAHIYEKLLAMGASPSQASMYTEGAPTYWGDQPFVGAPAYIGAVVLFLFVLALYLVKGKLKWWLVGASVLTLLLSWGKNFSVLTTLFIDYFPMYDKFRAVSSIQVIIELCVPILAVVGLQRFFSNKVTEEEKTTALKYATGIVGGIAILFLLLKGTLFNFVGARDGMLIQQLGLDFVDALKEDRKAIFTADTLRSLVLVLLVAGGCWAYLKNKIKQPLLIVGIAILIVFDLVVIDRKYVNNDNFVSAKEFRSAFVATKADNKILEDKGHYRVYDLLGDPFNSGRASYFHNALGGYHAAKMGRIQDLFEFYISKGDVSILNMFNVKYFITKDEKGAIVQENPYTNGNAWFVSSLKEVTTADDEILGLKGLKNKETALIHTDFSVKNTQYSVDSLATIKLQTHQPNKLVYTTNNSAAGFAVFSEVYYKDGWQAYIDGKPVSHVRVNYILRGLEIPEGKHTVTFAFEPQVIQTGSTITVASSILFILLLAGFIFYDFRKNKKGTHTDQAH
ncbi:YfhO family protein [Aquimarina sp. TRL1]|uniref:YfhO family protein n=1 Tax=Aquimarina sp. (strain TRL1) TaxID=2736252 RepID=UPI0034CF3718